MWIVSWDPFLMKKLLKSEICGSVNSTRCAVIGPKKIWKVKVYGYCSLNSAWTVAANFDFSNFFGPITAHRVLFTDPQISLFSNFFIKNGSHDTIHTFKNYFATVFFSFQFSAVSKRTLSTQKCLGTFYLFSFHFPWFLCQRSYLLIVI